MLLLIYTIGIPGEPEQNYTKQRAEPEIDIENVIRGAWISRYEIGGYKPWMHPFEYDKVARVMDIDIINVE